MAMMV